MDKKLAEQAEQEPVEFEDALEAAYWEFDARVKGYGKWKLNRQSERDAFKCAVRGMSITPPVKPVNKEPVASVEEWVAQPHPEDIKRLNEQRIVGHWDSRLNDICWNEGLVNADLQDGQPLYTAPQPVKQEPVFFSKCPKCNHKVTGTHIGKVWWCPKCLHEWPVEDATQPVTTPDVCGEVCVRAKLCYGCGKTLDEANRIHEARLSEQEPVAWTATRLWNRKDTWKCPADIEKDLLYAAPVQPVKQEPVAIVDEIGLCLDGRPIFNAVGKVKVGQQLYAAPVQQVDLTDDEINQIINKNYRVLQLCRAVIAAYKEKNK